MPHIIAANICPENAATIACSNAARKTHFGLLAVCGNSANDVNHILKHHKNVYVPNSGKQTW